MQYEIGFDSIRVGDRIEGDHVSGIVKKVEDGNLTVAWNNDSTYTDTYTLAEFDEFGFTAYRA